MQIRQATIDDIDALNSFYVEMNEIINKRTNNYNPDNPVFPSAEMVQESVLNQEQFLGIEDGIIVIACIANHHCAQEYDNVKWQVSASRDEFLVLHALRVSPDYERRGFARQMLQFIAEVAKERQQKAIRLDVLEGYSVQQLYLTSGYEYVDTIEILYEDIGSPQRFRLFERVL